MQSRKAAFAVYILFDIDPSKEDETMEIA